MKLLQHESIALVLLINFCRAVSHHEDFFESELNGRYLKGSKGGFKGSSGGSSYDCDPEVEECPEWWVGIVVFAGFALIVGGMFFAIRCYKRWKDR